MAGYRSIGTNPYNELNFLTNSIIDNSNNTDTIYNTLENDARLEKEGVAFKGKTVIGTEKLKQHFNTSSDNTTVVNGKRIDVNPYTKLISDFSKDSSYNSLKLTPADFVYLSGIKNMPLNRLWVLRRFADGVIVPDNLTDWQTKTPPEPIAVVVGWVSPTEDSFHSYSFNEEWETMTKRWDQVIFDMMDNEFGIKMGQVIHIPGFSQGLLFGFLEKMGVTSFDSDNIPLGNPNILAEGATRIADAATQKQGLKSNFIFNLNTEYEQKFLGDVDPGSAMMDILYNLTRMGTSNMEYMFRRDSEIIQTLLQAATAKNSKELWMNFITTVVEKFIEAVSEVFQELTGIDLNEQSTPEKNSNNSQNTGYFDYNGDRYRKKEKQNEDGSTATIYQKYNLSNNSGYAGIDEKQYNSAYNAYKKDPKQAQKNEANKAKSNISGTLNLANGAIKTILASTVAKYKWPLIGGVGVGTGINTTPWHITIGNPYSPFVSMGNIIVEKVEVKTNNELSFNDIPTRFSVNIQAKQGRNMGGQEMLSAFNNGYMRVYENVKAPEDLKVKTNAPVQQAPVPVSVSTPSVPNEPEPLFVNIVYTYSSKLVGDSIIITTTNNANLDSFETTFGKNYSYNDNGLSLRGVEGCTKAVSFVLDNFGDNRNGIKYPVTGTKIKVE